MGRTEDLIKKMAKASDPREIVKRRLINTGYGATNDFGTNIKKVFGFGVSDAEKKNRQKFDEMSSKGGGVEERDGRLVVKKSGIGVGAVIGTLIVISIVVFGFGFVTNNVLILSAIQYAAGELQPLLNQPIGGVPLRDSGKYVGCLWENSFIYKLGTPSSIDLNSFGGGADIFELCKQDLAGAQEVGCAECFTIEAEPLNPRLFAGSGQSAVIIARVRATDTEYCYNYIGKQTCQPLTPAVDSVVSIETGDGVIKAILDEPNLGQIAKLDDKKENLQISLLDPNILDSTPFTIVGKFPGDQFCGKNSIDAAVVLKYTYRTEGSATINVREARIGESATTVSGSSPITLPGPLKIDIIPDSFFTENSYISGITNVAYLSIKFRNVGGGQALVKNIHLSQIPPEGSTPLKFLECVGPIADIPKPLPADGSIDITPIQQYFLLDSTQRSGTILCSLDISGVKPQGDLTTYVITGSATYDYELKRAASSIIVEQTPQCESVSPLTTTGGGAVPTASGATGGGTTGGGTSVAQCTDDKLATEDKTCPAGGTFQESGCCA